MPLKPTGSWLGKPCKTWSSLTDKSLAHGWSITCNILSFGTFPDFEKATSHSNMQGIWHLGPILCLRAYTSPRSSVVEYPNVVWRTGKKVFYLFFFFWNSFCYWLLIVISLYSYKSKRLHTPSLLCTKKTWRQTRLKTVKLREIFL